MPSPDSNAAEDTKPLAPVDASRLHSTNYLFHRYTYIDVETPKTLSPVSSKDDLHRDDSTATLAQS